jgi:hypothetical protein
MKTYEITVKLASGLILNCQFTAFANEDVCDYENLIMFDEMLNIVKEKELSSGEYKDLDTQIINFVDSKFEELIEDFYANRQYRA